MSIAEKLTTIAENEPKVYDAGVKSEYDRFWDDYQRNGASISYIFAFSGNNWTDETFKPKYKIVIKGSQGAQMFMGTGIKNIDVSNIDFSQGTALQSLFGSTTITPQLVNVIGTLNLSSATNITSLFHNCAYLKNAGTLIFPSDPTQMINNANAFRLCSNLEEIRFQSGVIGFSVSFIESKKLSHDSLMSIINALYDYAGSGKTYTLTVGSTNLAKLTNAEKAIATEKGWTLA